MHILGWTLFIVGGALLAAYGAFEMARAIFGTDVPWPVTVGGTALVVGLLLLLVAAIRDRVSARKGESFEEVEH